jgi:hypothetical protein
MPLCFVLAGCGMLGSGVGAPPAAPAAPSDPTPLARCKVAASASSPLVTEWPASEKAHLESSSASGAVAVEYSGCELRLVDACKPSGRYGWRRTTLARDSIEVANADELWAKLPLGAASLEGELERSGRLEVQTTISGQLALEGFDPVAISKNPECARVTHVVSAISVGAFELVAGGSATAGGGVGIAGVGAGAKHVGSQRTMRSAGDPARCADSTDEAPDRDCASPVQLFLQPVGSAPSATAGGAPPSAPSAEPPASGGVQLSFPAPEDEDEHWSLRDANGLRLCDLPCTRVVPIVSGYYLERANVGGKDVARIDLPARLALPAGSSGQVEYRAERGSPLWSKLAFYGLGIPSMGLTAFGIGMGIAASNSDDPTDHSRAGLWYGLAVFYAASAAGTYWWYAWSHDASFDAKSAGGATAARGRRSRSAVTPTVTLGPGFVSGTF